MKIEFDLPEFDKELNINIIIRKDGEVVYSTSSPSGNLKKEILNVSQTAKEVVDDQEVNSLKSQEQLTSTPILSTEESLDEAKTVKKKPGGNMMDVEF